MKETCVFDIEADGLHPTKIHCLSAHVEGKVRSTANMGNVKKFFAKKERIIVAHNGIRFDVPAVERLLEIKVECKVVDTLILSWYLFPDRLRHGLAEWGEYFGVPKPPVDDWENLPLHVYIHRCEEDVRINLLLWEKIWDYLMDIYEDEDEAWRLIDYLMFKMDCAREQERSRWKLDVVKCEDTLVMLQVEKAEKERQLINAMPRIPVTTLKNKPAKPFKQDGSMSVTGEKWFALLSERNLPDWWVAPIEVVTGDKAGNPNSSDQLKSWLESLGWVPETFKFVKRKEEDIQADMARGNFRPERYRPISQINMPFGAGICPSIKRLYHKEPSLELLDGLAVISHRISILNGFMKNVDGEGYVQALIQGLTNTLRFKHSVVLNLPGIDKPYGKDIRGCLIAPDGYELCGSDMCSLEDRTKQHYMYPYDPEYVKEMMTPDFDPHIDLCVQGGLMTLSEANQFKGADDIFKKTPLYKALGGARKRGKATNYAAVYGAAGATVARSAGITEKEGCELVEIYWKRNWSVKKIAEDQVVKEVNGQKWLFNPVSRLWYSLRAEKDRFSTLNQGTGVYCFDQWIKNFMSKRPQLTGQMHDEVILCVKKGSRKKCTDLLKWAVQKVNKDLNLNRELDVDVQFGDSYAAIH